jgi:MFS family permease
VPAFAAAGLAGANLLFGLLVLPESLPQADRKITPLLEMNPISQLRGVVQIAGVRRWLVVVLLVNLSFAGLQSNFPLFSGERFGWNPAMNAYFFAFVGFCAVVTQAGILGPLRDRIGERRLVIGGACCMAFNLAAMAVVPIDWLLFPAVALIALGSNLAIPALTGLIAGYGDESGQGRVMGALQVCVNTALVSGPLLAGVAFDYIGIGAPYLISGIVAGVAAGVAAYRPG